MPREEENRAVSELIGFILLFSFVIIAFTIYQGIVVPDQNRVSEFEHNQEVQGEIQDLRNAIMSAALGGTERTVSVTLGADYPQRTIARNLGYSGGSLRTTSTDGARTLVIENASAVDRYGETADYWNGSGTHRFESRALVYEPMYSRYADAPSTVYENTLAYNRFGDGVNLSITGESLVDGKRITLVSLVGNLSESGTGTVSVDPDAISASTRRISIRNESNPINVTIPTRLDATWWNETLHRENVSQGGYVTAVRDTGDRQVSIHLKAGETYTLRMAKIGVGASGRDESVRYLTLKERPSETVFNDTSHAIILEARDRFNNPVSGARVNASAAAGSGSFSETTLTTSTEGEAIFNYTAPSSTSSDRLRFNVTPEDGGNPEYEVVWVNLSVKSSGGSGGGSDSGDTENINPGGTGEIILTKAEETSKTVSRLHFNNTADADKRITAARISFYYPDQSGNRPGTATINGTTFDLGQGFNRDVSATIADSTDATLDLSFGGGDVQSGNGVSGDFFILSVEFEEGTTATYFVAVEG